MKINSTAFNLFVQNAYETMYTSDDNDKNNNHDTENGDDDDNRGQPPLSPPTTSRLVPSLVIYYQTQQINILRTENIELRTENIELKDFQSIAEITFEHLREEITTFEHLREEVDNHRNASLAQNTTIDVQEQLIQRLQQLVEHHLMKQIEAQDQSIERSKHFVLRLQRSISNYRSIIFMLLTMMIIMLEYLLK